MIENRKIQKDKKHFLLKGISSVTVHNRCRRNERQVEQGQVELSGVNLMDFDKKEWSAEFVARQNKKPLTRREKVQHCNLRKPSYRQLRAEAMTGFSEESTFFRISLKKKVDTTGSAARRF